ncbi:MAG: M14 family metallopeptidase [Planctomycetota bacterium]
MSIWKRGTILGALAILALSGTARAQDPKVQIAWNRYYDYDETTALLRRLVDAFPWFLSIESIGKSHEGRDMWVVTINNPDTGPPENKAAMYIDANVHGNEIQGTETCLYTISYLMENYERIAKVKRLVDERVFYILPMVNPDGRDHWFDAANTSSSSRSGKAPLDNDRDGELDEDGPDDLDGDGHITQMRIKDPEGRYKRSPADPRLLIPVAEGEQGEYSLIGSEGIDNDGDGRVNEDGPGGYDMNRNWPSGWQPNYVQGGAGPYPLCWPETRSIAEFILSKPNIAGVQSYHNSGGMILRGPGYESYGEYPRGDVAVYDELGQTGEKMLPFYRYMIIWRDLYSVYGGFVNWTYEGLGIFSFTNELFSSDQYDSGQEREEGQNRSEWRQQWDDLMESGNQYIDWHPYDHPVFGEIEIGGWKKTSSRVAPHFLIEEMLHRNTVFSLEHADQMPMPTMSEPAVASIGQGAFTVTVTLDNERAIPTVSELAAQKRIGLPDFLEITGEDVRVVAVARRVDRFPEEYRRMDVDQPGRLSLERGVSKGSPQTYRFWVRGSGDATITLRSQKGGTRTKTLRIE